MAVRIMIKRTVPPEKEQNLLSLIMYLRILAAHEPGYISGETLRKIGEPETFLVISNWQSSEDWENWRKNGARESVQKKIDDLLGSETQYEMYRFPDKQKFDLSDFIAEHGSS
ncbi:MAG: antibiotic biosynthesis monooxygenase [Deltaproteobacteria bacterium]|nr:antibiotic biosynthesis monooxygenase [Deltaproteobacteria bacterium]